MNITTLKNDLRELRDYPSIYDIDTHADLHADALTAITKLETERREWRRSALAWRTRAEAAQPDLVEERDLVDDLTDSVRLTVVPDAANA